MSNSLKVVLYIFFVAVIFFFVQDRYGIFDISFKGSQEKKEEQGEVEEVSGDSSVEISNEEGNTIVVKVDVSDTDEKRALGLSGRKNLGDYEGMLWVL